MVEREDLTGKMTFDRDLGLLRAGTTLHAERTGEGQRERETQNPKQAPGSELSARSPTWSSNP